MFRYYSAPGQDANDYMIRMGAVTPLTDDQRAKAEAALRAKKIGDATLVRLEHSEGGDKVYLRFDKAVGAPEAAVATLTDALKEVGVVPAPVQQFGRSRRPQLRGDACSASTPSSRRISRPSWAPGA